MSSPEEIKLPKRYHFEIRLEQCTPGVVEAISKQEARELVEAGFVDFGDEYYSSAKIQWIDEKEVDL